MKIVYVIADGDYDAMTFEDSREAGVKNGKVDIKLWNKIREQGHFVVTDGTEEYDLSVEALEFDAVDPNFIGFIKSTLLDYDATKHTNFYVVNE